MSVLKVEMTNTFSLDKSEMNNLLYSKSCMEAEKIINKLNADLNKFVKAFSKRFVMTEQNVWYDFVTGLILPNFEDYRPACYCIGDIAKGDHKKILRKPIEFYGFSGRLMTKQEAQALLDPKVRYPYRHDKINKFDILVGQIRFNQQKNNPVVYRACKSGTLILTQEFSCNQDGVTVYNSKLGEFIKGSESDKAVAIPVYGLTDVHPLGWKVNDEAKKIEYKVAAATLIDNGLWPKEVSEKVKERFINTLWSDIGEYVIFDDKTGKYRLNGDKFRQAWKASQNKPQKNEFITKMIRENDFGKGVVVDMSFVKKQLLDSDYVRANLYPYPENILTDLNAGHWELYEQIAEAPVDAIPVKLTEKLPARPAALDIRENGICAIDFGTKSTTIVCRNNGEHLRRIGRGDLSKSPRMEDYENPTVIELRDIQSFLKAYKKRDGRPFTKWEQVTVSHAARNRLLENEDRTIFQSVFSELKQWARSSNSGYYRMRDQKGHEVVLPSYTEIAEGDLDPIEIYAYYLGLYINNMHHDGGIYLEYILSYPVKYPKQVRDCIKQSFERGLKKSLPPSILHDDEIMQDFSVEIGASEPAAYAACALKELCKVDKQMRPTQDKHICYGVFDFGGGTTDFDYGIWRLPNENDAGSWNYVIEHFGAGSDEDLGGENLLNLIAYQVFQDNIDTMRDNNIHFALPNGCIPFTGGELLIDESDAAFLNRRRLSEKLRPIWEQPEDINAMNIDVQAEEDKDMGNDAQSIVLFKDNETVSVSININKNKLQSMLKERIKRGVNNFFVKMWDSFKGKGVFKGKDNFGKIDSLLAGNSCKSPIVKELFEERIAQEEVKLKDGTMQAIALSKHVKGVFQLHLPLGMGNQGDTGVNYDRYPTGKTGVAFGLLACYRGDHNIKVIDANLSDDVEVPFRYYLGRRKGDDFEVTINMEFGYNVWAPFMDIESDDKSFSIYYTSEPQALLVDTPMPIGQTKYRKCRVQYKGTITAEEVCRVYIRKVAPTKVEYVVASPKSIEQEEYLTEVVECELE